jgi:type II secretory pathway pseudopilin PulG
MTRSAGFSIVEVLVAMGLALSILAVVFTLVRGAHEAFTREGERADMQQRLRVAGHAIQEAAGVAGAGPTRGPRKGALGFSLPPVLPFRVGVPADPPGTFSAGTLTVLSVPQTPSPQTVTAASMPARSGSVPVVVDGGCPPADAACGFAAGMRVVLLDRTGSYDLFTITSVQGSLLNLRHDMTDTSFIYVPSTAIAEVAAQTFYLKPDATTGSSRLMRYEPGGSDVAVVDHVVDLAVAYFGEPEPPALSQSVTNPIGPWTNYAPEPPPAGDQPTAYPPGENCVFQLDASGIDPVARLTVLPAGAGATLVELPAGSLVDGPWCPDAASPNRYDADLFRVRRVDVSIRVESALSALRGPAGALFARAGTARVAERWLPDLELRFSVTPRNLSAAR